MLALVRLTSRAALSTGLRTELLAFGAAIASETYVHIVGPLAGGLAAGLLFRLTHPGQCGDGTALFKARREALRAYLMELVGTMLLAFTVACALGTSQPFAPVAIGSVLVSMVYAGASTSGAHYNPAVTIGVSLRRALAWWNARLLVHPLVSLGYIVSQVLGAIGGGLLASRTLARPVGYPQAASTASASVALLSETFATTFLVYVVLQTATVERQRQREYFGLAIGFTLLAMAVTVGPVSGAALNPAIALLGRIDAADPFALTVTPSYYFAGPALGAVVASLIFRLATSEEFEAPATRGMV